MRPHLLQIVDHRHYGAPFNVPAPHQSQQIIGGARVQSGEGLIQQDHGRVLQQQTRKLHALELPHGKGADGPRAEIRQIQSRQRGLHGLPLCPAQRAPSPHARPVPQGDHVLHSNGKRAVNGGLLGQIGQVSDALPAQVDAPPSGRQQARQGLEQRGFSRAVGPHHSRKTAGRKMAAQMPHGGMPTVGQRKIANADGAGLSAHKAHQTTPQSNAHSAAATASLRQTDQLKGEKGAAKAAQLFVVVRIKTFLQVGVGAGCATPSDFYGSPAQRKTFAAQCPINSRVQGRVAHFATLATTVADQQKHGRAWARTGARTGHKGVERFQLVGQTVLLQKIQRPIDAGRGNGRAAGCRNASRMA